MHGLKAGGAEPAFRNIDDAFERKVVRRLGDKAQIGDGVADLGALVEPCAKHFVGKADGDEAFLEFARLEPGPHKDGHLRKIDPGGLKRFDFR